ncbi:MAG: winged helix-turn-helix transcriptional regulator [Rhizobiales bacterium]|nr:winged helix-turn-helix transcriptional regulator [Hyphomicrobiales bacterium]
MTSTPANRRRRASGPPRKRTPGKSRTPAPPPRDAASALTPQVRSILDRFRLEDVVSHLLRRAHFAAEERFAREFADEQITPRQKATLIAVYQRPGLSQNMLAEHLFMDRNTVAEMVTRLVARQLLERRPSAGDRRAHEFFLAPEGAAMLNRVLPRDAAIERAILQRLPKDDEKRFMKYLRLIVQTPQS